MNYTINDGNPVAAGDKISIKFEGLFNPVGKLAGVYNPTTVIVYKKNTGYEEKLFGSKACSITLRRTLQRRRFQMK